MQRAVETVLRTFGRIDVLVNALGDSIRKPLVPLPGQPAASAVSDDELRFIMDINLTEALLCTRAVGPHMLERRSGKVINIASWTAHQGGKDLVLYTAAKTALVGFTRAQALEWASYGVHVNAISPGIVSRRRDFRPGALQADRRSAQSRTCRSGGHGELREVGLLALYLASKASDYMTGQTIVLDGGLSL